AAKALSDRPPAPAALLVGEGPSPDAPWRTLRAPTLARALAVLGSEGVDAVLLPAAEAGVRAVRSLRVAAPGAAVLVLAEEPDDALAVRLLEAGAQDFLVRPEPADLARALRHAVARQSLHRAELDLRIRERQQAAVAILGQLALSGLDFPTLASEALA